MSTRYEDIIALPHHVSRRHPQMDRAHRAAQFAAFSALYGYEERIQQTEADSVPAEETAAWEFADPDFCEEPC